jgi:hypothetical protein
LSIQDIDKRIDEKIKSSIQNIDTINTLSIQDIDNRIAESLADGGIGEAIATSYAGMMAQFNGLLEEWQELQKQVEELKSVPPAEELTIDNEEPTNEILTTLQETDSENNSDTQLPGDELTEIKSDNSPAPTVPDKNQIDYVRKKLKKIDIEKTAAQIRETFINLGFDGTNYEDLRGEIIEALSNE